MAEPYLHPAFPQPKSAETVLWRYMDAWKFDWLVSEKRLFMARADQLGDPLEGTSPEGHRKWWQQQLENAASDTERAIVRRNEEFLASFRNAHYVSCWHASPDATRRMWDEYASSAEAVAIHTTFGRLRGCLPSYVELGLVRYIDYGKADLPSLNIFQRITHKDLPFKFEQELRCVATRPGIPALGQEEFDAAHFELEGRPAVSVFAPPIDLARLVVGVIVHPKGTREFRARITSLCSEHGLPSD